MSQAVYILKLKAEKIKGEYSKYGMYSIEYMGVSHVGED